jgi:hypothetical protein
MVPTASTGPSAAVSAGAATSANPKPVADCTNPPASTPAHARAVASSTSR